MAQGNGSAPILISGGGIGGLATAYALSRQGFAVRVFEQSPEFREVGAGIQLGPNIFRMLEKIGLRDEVLADAHHPPAQEMRDALTGKLITRVPLDGEFTRLRPALRGHPPRRHRHLPQSLPEQQPDHARDQPARRRLRRSRRPRHRHARKRRARRRQHCSAATACGRAFAKHIVGDGKPRVSATSPIAPCSSAMKCRRTCGGPRRAVGRPARTSSLPLRRGVSFSSPCFVRPYEEGWNAEGART